MRTRVAAAGAVVVAVYLVAAVATLSRTGHRYLPLYEGIGPPPSYQWVHPPPAFASGNTAPKAGTCDLALTGPPEPFFVSTPEGQLTLSLPAGALPAHVGDTKVHCAITPVDAATLAPLPAGVAADGNAYRVELTYVPSGMPVPPLTMPGNVVMTGPVAADSVLRLSGGGTWTRLASQTVSGPTVLGASFTGSDYYVLGTAPHRLAAGNSSTSGGRTGFAILVGFLVFAGVILVGGFEIMRRRRAGERGDIEPG